MTDFTIRPLTIEERKYTYSQSTQLEGQTGCIGHLRGDFGSGGKEFWTTWEDRQKQWKTDEFRTELDDVINALRSDEYGLLKDRQGMASFARSEPDSAFRGNFRTEYGFRADTKDHAFLIRCDPMPGDYNFYCYCYVGKWLDRSMEAAREDIRFIDSGYNDLFRIPDGGSIVITTSDGEKHDRVCRYVDSAHVEVGGNLYHICEFAERMERIGSTYAPKEVYLPRQCLSTLPSTGEPILINRYEKGYHPRASQGSPEKNRACVDRYNSMHNISKAQEAAMLAGSMFGWNIPAANPKNYDENGKMIKPKARER